MLIDPSTAIAAAKQTEETLTLLGKLYLGLRKKFYPKAPRNSTGIIIGIITEDAINREQVKNDFIRTLEDLLASSKAKRPFHIIDLPPYHTEKIKTLEDAGKVLERLRFAYTA